MLHILQKNKLKYKESLEVLSFDVDERKILTRYVDLTYILYKGIFYTSINRDLCT